MIEVPKEVFEIGILKKDYHERLLADLDRVASQAGIPAPFVWSKLSQYCNEADVAWVKALKHGKDNGMAYIGEFENPIEDRMMAITGACLRNYVDARLMSVQEVLSRLKSDNMPHPTVLLIPNFCLDKKEGGDIPAWQVSGLLGMLYARLARGLKTVVHVGSMEALQKYYGEAFYKHITAHYKLV